MLKNEDFKTRLNKMSAEEVGAIFPFELVGKELGKSGENEVCVTQYLIEDISNTRKKVGSRIL